MGGLFASPVQPANTITPHDKAVLDVKNQRDKLRQYKKKLEVVITRERQVAKELLQQGKKREATLALKKKKTQESLLIKAEGLLDNLTQLIDTIEFTQIEARVFSSLKQGTEVLKKLNEEMNLDSVEALMLDTQEAIDTQRQIEETLAGQLTAEDEDDILAELEQYKQEALLEKMPPAPQGALPQEEKVKIAQKEEKVMRGREAVAV